MAVVNKTGQVSPNFQGGTTGDVIWDLKGNDDGKLIFTESASSNRRLFLFNPTVGCQGVIIFRGATTAIRCQPQGTNHFGSTGANALIQRLDFLYDGTSYYWIARAVQ